MRGAFGLAFLTAALVGSPAGAWDDAGLSIGDPVPAVDIAHFLQGAPLKDLDKGKTYVLEFWATW